MATDPAPKPQKEVTRLKARIKHLQRDKDKSFPDLGRMTYQACLDGKLSDPALVEAGNRIREMDSEIEQANAEIARLGEVIRQMKTAPAIVGSCGSCGAPVTAGLRFCGSCGAPLAQPQAAPPPPGLACPSCAAPVAPGARFCGECGTPFEAAASVPAAPPAPPVPPAPVAPAPPAPSPPAPPPAPETAAGSETSAAPPEDPASRCSACGAAVEEAGAAFCGECGAKI